MADPLFDDSAHEREARLCYEAHVEQMKLAYPPYDPKPWDNQDESVRQAWAEHVRPYLRERSHMADRFQRLCGALLDWLEEQGYSSEDADAILRQLIDKADANG